MSASIVSDINPIFAQNPSAPPIEWYIHRGVQTPGIISFAAGLVDPCGLLELEIQKATERVCARFNAQALQYTSTQGLLPLREKIADFLSESDQNSNSVSAEELLISNGSQQALDLIARALLNPGDIVLLESPSYYVFVHALKSFNVRAIHLKMDDEGIDPDDLLNVLNEIEASKQSQKLKFLYTIPYAHNPLGFTTIAARKQKIAEIWKTHSASAHKFILEDAAYRELVWEKEVPHSYANLGLDRDQWVYLGSFSKAFAPGFKIGYARMPASLLEVCLRIKANEDFGSSSLNQYVLCELMNDGSFARQIASWKILYQYKAHIMQDALEKYMPKTINWKSSTGGLYYWINTPEIDTGKNSKLFAQAIENKVLYIPSELGFYEEGFVHNHGLRLAYGFVDVDLIDEGVRRLGEILGYRI